MKNNYKIFLALIWIILGYLFFYSFSEIIFSNEFSLTDLVNKISVTQIITAILLYLSSHLVRSFRLVIMTSEFEFNFKFRDLIIEQFKANSVNLLIPFKLGESYRVFAFKKFFKNHYVSFNLLIVERFFDFLIIFIFLAFGLFISGIKIAQLEMLTLFAVIIILLFSFSVYIFGDLMLLIHKIFVLKKISYINNIFIKISGKLYNSYINIIKIATKKVILLTLISVIIWTLECSVLLIFYDNSSLSIDLIILLCVSIALSNLLPNGPVGLGGVQLAFFTIYSISNLSIDVAIINSYIYSSFIFGSGLLVGGIFFLINLIKKK